MGSNELTSPLIFLGIILIIIGIMLVVLPALLKFMPKLEEIHPFLIWYFKVDGITVGTSPAFILVAVLIYIIALLFKH